MSFVIKNVACVFLLKLSLLASLQNWLNSGCSILYSLWKGVLSHLNSSLISNLTDGFEWNPKCWFKLLIITFLPEKLSAPCGDEQEHSNYKSFWFPMICYMVARWEFQCMFSFHFKKENTHVIGFVLCLSCQEAHQLLEKDLSKTLAYH